ncbi:MAG TPA: MarR family transcriptional regulator [Streptosporangiaceae bacterium]|nr:MarR family transcriptional regulator [Streptosporangiaceae bacterium]
MRPVSTAACPAGRCARTEGPTRCCTGLYPRNAEQTRLRDHLRARAGVDLDQAGLAALYVLHTSQSSLRLTELAEHLRIDAPAVTRKAQQLERAGLVSRTRDEQDARATRLQLTDNGRQTLTRYLDSRRTWLATLLADWPEAERAEFARLLGRFNHGVQASIKELDEMSGS